MTPEELRADIPVCERAAYMNTGASGPAPRRVVEATTGFVEHHEYEAPIEEGAYPAAFGTFDDVRARVAEFIGAAGEEVALTESTADGIAKVAAAIDWEAGDTVDCEIGGTLRTVLVSVHPAATLYDRSQADTFEATIQRAADLTGAGGQSTLGSC
mgnify:CR=1 FL=1